MASLGMLYIDGVNALSQRYTISNSDTYTVTSTGITFTGMFMESSSPQTWTYSGTGTFAGFAIASGATTPHTNLEIGDSGTFNDGTWWNASGVQLYTVEATTQSDAYITTDTDITKVANAIRSKLGSGAALQYPFTPAINSMVTGSLQSRTVTFDSPGSTRVSPQSGYVGMSDVELIVNISGYDGGYTYFGPPVKGDVITLNMDGTAKNYRVLRINGYIAEVLSQFSVGYSKFATSGQVYAQNALDTLLNTTWYNSCNASAKSAIVDKTFRQEKWYVTQSGNPIYVCAANGGTQYVGLANTTFGSQITRHVYALGVQDIIDYVEATPSMTASNTTFTVANTRTMFNSGISDESIWLCSASGTDNTKALRFSPNIGTALDRSVTNEDRVFPAFQIDLSKINWSYAS